MSELPYRPEHVNDAIADSEELNNEELGAYVRLQRALWRAGGYLPAKELARFARAGKRWGAIGPAVVAKLVIADGRASCTATLALLLRTRERRAKAVERATKAGLASAARRQSDGNFAHTSKVGLNGANPLKSLNAAQLVVGSELTNQNQNHTESKSLSTVGAAAGGRDEKRLIELNAAIYDKGVQLLVDKVGLRAIVARSQIAKWLVIAGREEELVEILQAGAAENLRGAQLIAIIDQKLNARKRERERGLSLRFGLQNIKSQ